MYSTFEKYFKNVKNPDINIIMIMIEKGANDWNYGLNGACKGGHLELIDFMIKRGATSWNLGLWGACEGGHLEIAKLMIEKGANALDRGLFFGCKKGHLEIVKLMTENGADIHNSYSNYDAVKTARNKEYLHIIEYLVPKLHKYNTSCFDVLTFTENLLIYKFYLKNKGALDLKRYKKLVCFQCPVYYLMINKESSKLSSLPMDLIRHLKTFM